MDAIRDLARFAASMAARASSRSAFGSVARTSPVTGLILSKVSPATESIHSPPMYMRRRSAFVSLVTLITLPTARALIDWARGIYHPTLFYQTMLSEVNCWSLYKGIGLSIPPQVRSIHSGGRSNFQG